MSLFVVNRYTGEDEAAANDKQPNEANNLLKLQKKIMKNMEKRKRLRMQKKIKQNKKLMKGYANDVKVDSNDKKVEKEVDNVEVQSKIENDTEHHEEINENGTSTQNENEKQNEKMETTPLQEFEILGTDKFSDKKKVKRVLPSWLLNPVVICNKLEKASSKKLKEFTNIDKDLRSKLKQTGIKRFFPVQSTVIPFILESAKKRFCGIIPQDICVSAPTGSGKTITYVIPVLKALRGSPSHIVRALVILPTQSLAFQVYSVFKLYAEDLGIEIGLATGSNPFENEQKQLVYNSGETFGYISKVDVLVCTPGRLVEHLNSTKGLDLTHLEYLVIDEADRVLDNIQDNWLTHLENHIYGEGQNATKFTFCNIKSTKSRIRAQRLLFSATLSQDPEKLQKLNLFQPVLFTSVVTGDESDDEDNKMQTDNAHFVGKYTMPTELTEKYIMTSLETKPLSLYKYIKDQGLTRVLVFTNSIESVHRLRILLKALAPELNVREISSKMTLKKKKRLMTIYGEGTIDILVCTDAMARGIDLPNVNAVFSYAAPRYLKTYIHRVGRTARAGAKGAAVTLVEPHEKDKFLAMLREANKTTIEQIELDMDEMAPLADKYKEALLKLKDQLAIEDDNAKLIMEKERGKMKNKFKRRRKPENTKTNNTETVVKETVPTE